MRTTRSNSSPLASSGVSERTRDVAGNAGWPMTRRSRRRVRRARRRGPTQIRGRSVDDGDAGAADGDRHVGVRERGPDDRLGFGHDLFRCPVVDAQRGQVDLAQPDPLQPFLPRLGEPVPGLGPVPDDGEAPGRAAGQQHLPLRVGQFLSLVHDDVRERPASRSWSVPGSAAWSTRASWKSWPRSIVTRPDAVFVVGAWIRSSMTRAICSRSAAATASRRRLCRAAAGSPSRRRAASRSGRSDTVQA